MNQLQALKMFSVMQDIMTQDKKTNIKKLSNKIKKTSKIIKNKYKDLDSKK